MSLNIRILLAGSEVQHQGLPEIMVSRILTFRSHGGSWSPSSRTSEFYSGFGGGRSKVHYRGFDWAVLEQPWRCDCQVPLITSLFEDVW